MKVILLIVFLFMVFTITVQPSESPKFIKQVVAVRTNEKINVDGVLSESTWHSTPITGLIQEDPFQGVQPTQHSEFWVAYDNEAIYFAAKYYDKKPDSILARLVRRDFIWGDPSDGCVLYIDSYGDKRNGYFFYVSAAGAMADGLIENDVKQPNDLTWDAVWDGASHLDSFGWSVEMKIPYSQIRFKKGADQHWGINVERFISRSVETDELAYTPRNESGYASRFPELTGIEGINPPVRLEILPYVTGKAEYIGNDRNNPFNSGKRYIPGLGLDLRAGLGNSLILNSTINPDFGQVEVDPAVVNLTDVESSFEEKRPFFTEGVTIFRFGKGGINRNVNFNWSSPSIFYSRRIGRAPQGSLPNYDYADIPNGTHILGAAKISGKLSDNWRIGTIQAFTRREFADISVDSIKSSIEIEPLTYYGVFRAQRDFNSGQQGLGILSTYTNRLFKSHDLRYGINKDAFVAAADGWTNITSDGTYVLSGWTAISRVSGNKERMIALQRSSGHYFQRPDVNYIKVDSSATSLTGYAGRFTLNKNRGAFVINSSLGFLSPKFEINDIGFNSFSDIINTHLFTGYTWNEPTSWYQNAALFTAFYSSFDFGGNRTSAGYYLEGDITLHNIYGGSVSFTYSPETYNARKTRGGPLTLNPVSRNYYLNAYTDNRLWYVLKVESTVKSGEDTKSYDLTTTLEFKVTPTLTLQLGPEYSKGNFNAQWITSYSDITAKNTFSRRYIFAHLDQTTLSANIRTDWIINPRLSLQVYVQPLIASGKYDNFKELRRPKSYDFLKYGEEGSTLVKTSSETGDISYAFDYDGQGPAVTRTINNPDFNYLSLRGSAVFRWEYLPGSTLFLVWTQSRLYNESDGEFRFGHSMDTLFDVKPDNIFMMKISYWL